MYEKKHICTKITMLRSSFDPNIIEIYLIFNLEEPIMIN